MKIRDSFHRVLLAAFMIWGVIVAPIFIASSTTGCTKAQGEEIKSAVKEGLGFADAICLSGLLDNVNMSDKDRALACGITDVLNDAAQHFLVQERAQRTESVRRQVAAQMRTQVLTLQPCTNTDGGVGGLRVP